MSKVEYNRCIIIAIKYIQRSLITKPKLIGAVTNSTLSVM